MTRLQRLFRCVVMATVVLPLASCLMDDDKPSNGMPEISLSSVGDVAQIATADTSIVLGGTAHSEGAVTLVSWKNDRGGRGLADGTEDWSTSPINLQIGRNKLTVTAEDDLGNVNSRRIVVSRENGGPGATAADHDPVVLYSYNDDLDIAAPLHSAHLDADVLHIFFAPNLAWPDREIDRIEYRCCIPVDNPRDGQAVRPPATVRGAPWHTVLDATMLAAARTWQFDVIVHFLGGIAAERRIVNFVVDGNAGTSNGPPSISGDVPAYTSVGSAYSFLPTAIDEDGDTLSFNIENKPAWAIFDIVSGHLRGIPGTDDIGTHGQILISVSDGRNTAAMSPTSIQVQGSATGSAELSWEAPTERTDDTPLGNLAGFHIRYGLQSGGLDNEIRISNPSINLYVVDNLSAGDWRFVVSAFDAAGRMSAPSNELTKIVN